MVIYLLHSHLYYFYVYQFYRNLLKIIEKLKKKYNNKPHKKKLLRYISNKNENLIVTKDQNVHHKFNTSYS